MDIINENRSKRFGKLNIVLFIGAVILSSSLIVFALVSLLPEENIIKAKENDETLSELSVEKETEPPEIAAEEEITLDSKVQKAQQAILALYNAEDESKLTKEQLLKLQMAVLNVKNLYLQYGLGDMGDVKSSAYLSEYFEADISLLDETEIFIDVPYISQEGVFPNGCEAVSATMLLQHLGYNISADDFIDGYLYCLPYEIEGGLAYAPDPDFAYAGDPRSEDWGYGCYPPVIVKAINRYLVETYSAENLTGMSLDMLRKDYLEKGVPVAVWTTINFEKISKYLTWYTRDTNEQILYPSNLHCVVLCGYDGENYIFNDPFNSNGIIKCPVEQANEIYDSMGRRAVAIIKDGNK